MEQQPISIEGDTWSVQIEGMYVHAFVGDQYFSGSFQAVEDWMAENCFLDRKEFQQEVWRNGFLGGLR